MARRPGGSQKGVSRDAFLDGSCQHWRWKSRRIGLKPWGLLIQSQEGTRRTIVVLVERVVDEVRRSSNQADEKESSDRSGHGALSPETLAPSEDHSHRGLTLSHLLAYRNSVHRPSSFAVTFKRTGTSTLAITATSATRPATGWPLARLAWRPPRPAPIGPPGGTRGRRPLARAGDGARPPGPGERGRREPRPSAGAGRQRRRRRAPARRPRRLPARAGGWLPPSSHGDHLRV